MSQIERSTPEWLQAVSRVRRQIETLTVNLETGRGELPEHCFAFAYDKETGEGFGALIQRDFEYIDVRHLPKAPPEVVVDILMKVFPIVPLVCNRQIAEQLSKNPRSVEWLREDNGRLISRSEGTMIVYTPL